MSAVNQPALTSATPCVSAVTEYGTLRRVAMRYASNVIPALDSTNIHPVLARQKTTSAWASYSPQRVRSQQKAVIGLLRDRGTEVVVLPDGPASPAQHYPRDIAFVIDDVLFAARMNSTCRLPETDALDALRTRGSSVAQLAAGTIEGGDVMLHDGCVVVGLSEETSHEGVAGLQAALVSHSIDREVIPVHFAGRGIVHLDDHFNIVAPGLALIHRAAFPPEEIRWFTAHFEDLIDVTDEEALAVQVNVLAIAPGVVMAAAGSDRIIAQLVARGVEVLAVDYSEVTRIPGSLRCTTLPLLRT